MNAGISDVPHAIRHRGRFRGSKSSELPVVGRNLAVNRSLVLLVVRESSRRLVRRETVPTGNFVRGHAGPYLHRDVVHGDAMPADDRTATEDRRVLGDLNTAVHGQVEHPLT